MKKIPFTSASQDWRTPRKVYDGLHAEFKFQFDPCPSHALIDGLTSEWGSPAFVNPPFKEIDKWVRKSFAEWIDGKTVVMLIPARTDTRWWHDCVMKATEIRFLRGRLKYEGAKFNAPFPSCVVIFNGDMKHPKEAV